MAMSCSDLFLAFLAIIFPPIGVWIKRGICSADSLLNILLCMLGYLPGLLHAWYIIARYPEEYEPLSMHDEEAARRAIAGGGHPGAGGGRVTYVYVSRQDGMVVPAAANQGVGAPDGGKARLQVQRGPSYGAISGGQQGASSSRPQQPQTSRQNDGDDVQNLPPTYAEAIKGDNKVQTRD